MTKIILGSKSPRRRELLAGLGIQFDVVDIDADERFPEHLSGRDIPIYISRAKARAYAEKLQEGELLITSDTIVWVADGDRGEVLGKPKDEEDAKRMIRMLSGRTHQVYTGVCFATKKDGAVTYHEASDGTDVTFRELTDEEIDYYVQTYKPLDKAGAYGIQEWIGYVACTELRGSYFNVMGLPTEVVYSYLSKIGSAPSSATCQQHLE